MFGGGGGGTDLWHFMYMGVELWQISVVNFIYTDTNATFIESRQGLSLLVQKSTHKSIQIENLSLKYTTSTQYLQVDKQTYYSAYVYMRVCVKQKPTNVTIHLNPNHPCLYQWVINNVAAAQQKQP